MLKLRLLCPLCIAKARYLLSVLLHGLLHRCFYRDLPWLTISTNCLIGSSLRLCSEVEGEEEVIQANILITEVATVARFVEDEIIDGARIAKLEQIRGG